MNAEYLPTMRAKRVRDFAYGLGVAASASVAATAVGGPNNPTNNLTAGQMSSALHEIMRMHPDTRTIVFDTLMKVSGFG